MSKPKYHLLPVEETGRPSMDTLSDVSDHYDTTDKADFKAFHFTFYSRFLSFSLFLTAVILLRLGGGEAIPSMVFLSLALVHNFYITVRHLITRCLVVQFSLNSTGKRDKKVIKFLRVLPFVVDGILLLCLLIALPIGHKHRRSYHYWGNHDDLRGYIVSYVALPFYLLSAVDGGKPSSVAVYFKLKRKGGEDRLEQHRVSARDDVEAQQEHETMERGRSEGDAVLL